MIVTILLYALAYFLIGAVFAAIDKVYVTPTPGLKGKDAVAVIFIWPLCLVIFAIALVYQLTVLIIERVRK